MGRSQPSGELSAAVRVTNRGGRSPYVILCDHASNHVPAEFDGLGLSPEQLARHIAWDPGALPVSRYMATALDAVLVECGISRLVIDCNRPLNAPDLIAEISETTPVPGNTGLSQSERQRRIALVYDPYHAAVEEIVAKRLARGAETRLIAVHSFNPTYKSVTRPWHVGVVHDDDDRLSRPLISRLSAMPGLLVGDNQPYSPVDRVYFTLERHARARSLPCVMIEIRNDEIAGAEAQRRWGERLASIFMHLAPQTERQDSGGETHRPIVRAN